MAYRNDDEFKTQPEQFVYDSKRAKETFLNVTRQIKKFLTPRNVLNILITSGLISGIVVTSSGLDKNDSKKTALGLILFFCTTVGSYFLIKKRKENDIEADKDPNQFRHYETNETLYRNVDVNDIHDPKESKSSFFERER